MTKSKLKSVILLAMAAVGAIGFTSAPASANTGQSNAVSSQCSSWTKVSGPAYMPLWQYTCIQRDGLWYTSTTTVLNNGATPISTGKMQVLTWGAPADWTSCNNTVLLNAGQQRTCSTGWKQDPTPGGNQGNGALVSYTDPWSNTVKFGQTIVSPFL